MCKTPDAAGLELRPSVAGAVSLCLPELSTTTGGDDRCAIVSDLDRPLLPERPLVREREL